MSAIERLNAALSGRYRIESELGEGAEDGRGRLNRGSPRSLSMFLYTLSFPNPANF